ncbi:unnamed protein product [Gongylonema pulchrum]|uniref:SH2 domain-containing protein n=1 Tax=Gongylonema pulchrum TaxID=637853 RepID=A0A183DPA0_9BILA|nr:unnamed protein product [Gongylonema pulchrum]
MEEEIGYWKQNLYLLQEAAPRPFAVRCTTTLPDSVPPQYGAEFHGLIERETAESMLLEAGEGAFLVRASRRSPGANTLCMHFDGRVLNYKLFYDGMHYVGEKRFEELEDLVADGLITMHMEKHANDYIQRMADEAIYEQSPYSHERTIHDCRPEAKYVRRMFAVDISTLCMAHDVDVPPVVSACIAEVERRGLHAEGIYRISDINDGQVQVSGSHDQMERLRRQFDTLHKVDLSMVEDIHTVAGLLKLYLRLLPQQLVPFTVYRSLLTAYTNNRAFHERLKMCRKALKELNEANGRTLLAILVHMQKVADSSAFNKMSIENLATIFSPTLFCTGTTPALPQQQHHLLHFLIQNPRIVPFFSN